MNGATGTGEQQETGRWLRIGAGAALALAGALLGLYTLFLLREHTESWGRLAGPTFYALRAVAVGAIVSGCWLALKSWRRL